tara:strand:- start:1163 stop:1384 length:222 start_codon:yes stop_codon:yes gene_type:complete
MQNMKNENILDDIQSKSLKEAKEEINKILTKLENNKTDLVASEQDYEKLLKLNKHVNMLIKKKLKEYKKIKVK